MPFLGGFNDFGGRDQPSQDLKARNSDETQLIARSPQKLRNKASPADVTRALDPDLLSRGREPEHCNFKRL